MSEKKETVCSSCEHLWVCKYRDELLSEAESVDEIMKNSRFSYKIICSDYIEKKTIGIRKSKGEIK